MANFENQQVSGAVNLDGGRFVNCHFKEAVLTYRGGKPPRIQNCKFEKTQFKFAGHAAETIAFLKSMSTKASDMRFIVEGILPELKD